MKKITLPLHPREATQKILSALPNRRLRDVVLRRFGLASKKEETLEAIGKNYGITRERVRQIENDALRRLKRPGVLGEARQIFSSLAKHLDDHGGISEENKLLHSVADARLHPYVNFLLSLADDLSKVQEDETYFPRWYTKKEAREAAEQVLRRTVDKLAEAKKPVSAEQLFGILKDNARSILGEMPSPDMLDSYLGISKLIKQNPYGEFGLASWGEISPSGVRDKAYAALAKHGSPLHFREVARSIDKTGWDAKKAHPQTVHNELIKDNRFVLVGRGLYALKEWGYEPGTVADVIISVMKESRSALSKNDIVKRVLDKRRVKENTILLNLQNRKRFQKTKDGYTLV